MSDTTTDTSAIDDKKKENEGSSSDGTPNIGKFVSTSFIVTIFILIYFGISIFVLYGCKIAQSNILPTNADCYPFSDNKPTVTPIQTNIFKNGDTSMKLSFPYEENSKFKILDIMRNYKNTYDSHFLINYIISIIEPIISFDYKYIDMVLNTINSIPEVIIILFGPTILGLLSALLFFCNCFYGLILWFSNMSWFFKKNMNTERGKKPVWEDVTFTQPFNYGCGIGLVILFFLILIFCSPFLIIYAHIIISFCIIMLLTYSGKMDNKSVGYLSIFTTGLKEYKVSIFTIFSILIISTAFTNLGTVSGVSALIIIGCVYFGILNIGSFNKNIETNLTLNVSDLQAKREVCKINTAPNKEAHGLLYNMVFGGGGNLVKNLKNLNKIK